VRTSSRTVALWRTLLEQVASPRVSASGRYCILSGRPQCEKNRELVYVGVCVGDCVGGCVGCYCRKGVSHVSESARSERKCQQEQRRSCAPSSEIKCMPLVHRRMRQSTRVHIHHTKRRGWSRSQLSILSWIQWMRWKAMSEPQLQNSQSWRTKIFDDPL
jgi:hypothetical protein